METFEEETLDDAAEADFEPEPEGEAAVPTAPPSQEMRQEVALKTLRHMHEALGYVIQLLEESKLVDAAKSLTNLVTSKRQLSKMWADVSGGQVVEGVFDGINMIGENGKLFQVPSNYASKSRLVEGDMLKLMIRSDGRLIFKQIAPIERRRIVGRLALDPAVHEHIVVCEEAVYKVLPASVSYFKAEPGDEVVLLIPKSGRCVWGAVEHVTKK